MTLLLAALALIVAPHALHLPYWVSGLSAVLLLWRVWLLRTGGRLPSRWVLAVFTLSAVAATALQYQTLFGRDAGLSLLALLTCLKLLETRGTRDGFVLVFLGYFLAITHFLFSQTIPIGLYSLMVVWLITAALIGLNHPGEEHRRLHLRMAGVLLLKALPVMLVLFVLFPRVSGPLWGLPADARKGMTGLSDEMAPGSISQLSQSDAVAFRVQFPGKPPAAGQLYWRGPVLWRFDGRRWRHGPMARVNAINYTAQGAPLSYTVTLEPSNRPWLMALDLPATLPEKASVTQDFQLLTAQPVTQRMQYAMTSYLRYNTGPLSEEERQAALQLPRGGNPRALALGQRWRAELKEPNAVVATALLYFRNENFRYTLMPPLLGGENPVDDFLFDTRRGFCEHYAGAFTVLMRAAGIPARVVTGYQGGEYNTLGGYVTVRQADAHAWSEVWLDGRGWVRVDPTAAVSPARVESGIEAALPAGEPLPGLVLRDNPWLQQLRFGWDWLNGGWSLWVLGYNPERQLQLLAALGMGIASWEKMALWLLASVGSLMLVFYVFMVASAWRRGEGKAERCYRRYCERLARHGLPRGLAEGPLDYALRVVKARPEWLADVDGITEAYIALRYGNGGNPGELCRRVRRFRSLG